MSFTLHVNSYSMKFFGGANASGLQYPAGLVAARDRRNQHNFVPVLKRISIPSQKTNVLVIHVNVDEAPQLAGLVFDLCRQRWKIYVDVQNQSREIRSLGSQLLLAIRMPNERRGEDNFDSDDGAPSCFSVRDFVFIRLLGTSVCRNKLRFRNAIKLPDVVCKIR